jgi:hypothetical protein
MHTLTTKQMERIVVGVLIAAIIIVICASGALETMPRGKP